MILDNGEDYFDWSSDYQPNNKYMNFDFIKSTRFWAIVIAAVAVYLQTKGIIGAPEMLLIDTIMGGHVVLRTVDKFNE